MSQRVDWLDVLSSPEGASILETLRSLRRKHLLKSKCYRFGGPEWVRGIRARWRWLAGHNCLLFEPRAPRPGGSAVTRAFSNGLPLTREAWNQVLGPSAAEEWFGRGLLRETPGGRASCAFRAETTDRAMLLLDPDRPLNAPGLGQIVHFAQDGLDMLDFVAPRVPRAAGRYLDVGCGSGLIFLHLASAASRTDAIDCNGRAVAVSRLNARLNGLEGVRVECRDVFAWKPPPDERYDWVTWNAPFVHVPARWREFFPSVDGGEGGTETTTRFVRSIGDWLAPGGVAHVFTGSPVANGRSRLEEELSAAVLAARVDVRMTYLYSYWVPRLRRFHEEEGVHRSEIVMLEIHHGSGRLARRGPSRWQLAAARRAERGFRRAAA